MTEEKRPFAVFDIDGTLIRWQLWHAVIDQLYTQGLVSEEAQAAIKEARMRWKRREEGDDLFHAYEYETIKAYDQALSKLTQDSLAEAIEAVFSEYKDQTYVYTRNLIRELKAKNYLLFAISGSHVEIVEVLAKYYGFDGWGGTEFEYKDGRYTGEAKVMRREEKPKYLATLIDSFQAATHGSIGVGDTDSDIPMLEAVEQKIAFNPNKKLFQYAKEQDWKIVVERKNMVYELESKDGQYVLDQTDI